jgi:hypothetical protein
MRRASSVARRSSWARSSIDMPRDGSGVPSIKPPGRQLNRAQTIKMKESRDRQWQVQAPPPPRPPPP